MGKQDRHEESIDPLFLLGICFLPIGIGLINANGAGIVFIVLAVVFIGAGLAKQAKSKK
jgi:hypothetical protein